MCTSSPYSAPPTILMKLILHQKPSFWSFLNKVWRYTYTPVFFRSHFSAEAIEIVTWVSWLPYLFMMLFLQSWTPFFLAIVQAPRMCNKATKYYYFLRRPAWNLHDWAWVTLLSIKSCKNLETVPSLSDCEITVFQLNCTLHANELSTYCLLRSVYDFKLAQLAFPYYSFSILNTILTQEALPQ